MIFTKRKQKKLSWWPDLTIARMEAAKVSKDLQIEFDRLALKAAAGMVTKTILICHETN